MDINQEQLIQPIEAASMESTPGSESKYQPVSTWGYIGIMLLLGIPIVGPILAIVWALGGCRKINKRNFARASLIVSVFLLAVSLVAGLAVKKVVTEAIEEFEASMSAISKVQDAEVSLDDVMKIVSMLESAEDTSLNLEGIESVEDMEELDEAMTILEGLSEEDLSLYEDALNELFSDFEFESKEEQ